MLAHRELYDLLMRSFSETARELTFESVKRALNNRRVAAERWITWAVARGILQAGIHYTCSSCRYTHWLATNATDPGTQCPLCGARLSGLANPRHAAYYYRPSLPLRETLRANALGHLLALRLLSAGFVSDDVRVTGVHPGIEFLRSDEVCIEVDGLVLLSNGMVGVGEVKSKSQSLNEAEAARLQALADELDTAFTFFATPQPRGEVSPEFIALSTDLPGRPCITLTGDEIFGAHPRWTINSRPTQMYPAGEYRPDTQWLVGYLDQHESVDSGTDALFSEA